MGNSKKSSRKINPKVHEWKMKIAFFTIGIIAYIGLFIMGVIQKVADLVNKSINKQL